MNERIKKAYASAPKTWVWQLLAAFIAVSYTHLFQIYLSQLQNANAGRIDIFGYSGENDQHINRAIAQNPSIREIHYYCAPAKVSDPVEEFEVASRFSIKAPQKLMLESWNTIWNIFEQN